MPTDKTMGGEHPIAAIKRLAHWEVEDDIGMLRTRLACISAQVDKVTAATPAPADRAALMARLMEAEAACNEMACVVDDGAGWHERAEAIHHAIHALAAPPEAAPTNTICARCGHAESDHETVAYRGDKSRCCLACRAVVGHGVPNPCPAFAAAPDCREASGIRSIPMPPPLTLAESLAAIREDDCRAAVRAALLEVREAIMGDDGCLTVAGAVAILDAKLAALEDAPPRET